MVPPRRPWALLNWLFWASLLLCPFVRFLVSLVSSGSSLTLASFVLVLFVGECGARGCGGREGSARSEAPDRGGLRPPGDTSARCRPSPRSSTGGRKQQRDGGRTPRPRPRRCPRPLPRRAWTDSGQTARPSVDPRCPHTSLTLTPVTYLGSRGHRARVLPYGWGTPCFRTRGNQGPVFASLASSRGGLGGRSVSAALRPRQRAEVLVLGRGLPSASPQPAPGRGPPVRPTPTPQPAPLTVQTGADTAHRSPVRPDARAHP